jgi:hypothetical protein
MQGLKNLFKEMLIYCYILRYMTGIWLSEAVCILIYVCTCKIYVLFVFN